MTQESAVARGCHGGSELGGPVSSPLGGARASWLLALSMAVPVLAIAVPLSAQTVTLQAAEDTYLKSGSPNQNQGAETILRVQSSGNNRALVNFDQADILAAVGTGSLGSARLELFIASNANNWGATGRTVDLHRLTESWTEPGATWNCGIDANPSNGAADCGSPWAGGRLLEEPADTVLHSNSLTGWIAFDVTAEVTAVLAGGSHDGWMVKKTEEGQSGGVDYASRSAASGNAPRLVLVVESAAFDEVPPRLAITSPSDSILVNQPSPPVTVEYSDGGSGVDPGSLEVLLDGVDVTTSCSAGPTSATCMPGNLGEGPHTIEAFLRDLAGNLATASFSFELLTGPGLHTLRIPLAADTYLRQGSPNQNQGSEGFLRLQQSGKNRALLVMDPAEVASLLAGATVRSARVELYAEENGDNWGSAGRTVDLHRLTAPWSESGATWNCAADADPSNQQPDCGPQWNGGSFESATAGALLVTNGLTGWVDFGVTDDIVAMLGGGVHHGWLLKKTDETRSGRVEFTSRDGAAGQTPGVVVLFETATSGDLEPPFVAILAPADGAILGGNTPEIAASYSDAGSGIDLASVRLVVDDVDYTAGAVVSPGGLTFTPPVALEDGEHLALVTVRDLAGNFSQAFAIFTTDMTSPDLTVSFPPNGHLTNFDTVRVAGEAADPNGVDRVEAGGSVVILNQDGAFETEIALAEGTNSIAVRAVDRAGNSQELTLEVLRFSLPEVAISSPADLATIAATAVDVEGTISVGTASVVVNGVEGIISGTSFVASNVPLVEGGNVLTAAATDSQGHVGTDSVSVVRDLTPPRLAIYRPEDGATLFEPTVAVQGLVNDIVAGTVNVAEVAVTVNGQPAQVANRSFLLESLPLALGENLIEVEGLDEGGNTARVEVRVHRAEPAVSRVVAVSGSGQTAVIGTTLPQPLVVELQDVVGQPVPGTPVVFKVVGNDGSLGAGSRRVAVVTDAAGRAQVTFSLGTRAGVGNQVVEASAAGYAGPAVFLATALPGEPALIVVDSGGEQVGVAGREPSRPLVAAVTDAGFNRLAGVPVRLTVVKGQGSFGNGLQEVVTPTDSDGRAIVPFTLDPEEGIAGNVVGAIIDALEDGPVASFVATGRSAGPPDQTSISGVVLDNSNRPIPGVTVRIRDTMLTAEADAQGVFRIPGAPVGTVYLIVDGSTADRPGAWPDLEFILTTVPGRDNDVGMPIYLLPLNLAGGAFVDETHGATLALAEVPGFALEVAPGSVTFPGGTRTGVVSVTAVHSDKVPMVPNFGQQPRLIVTIQPAGARFDPPARFTLPNVEGLAPGAVTEFYSFDHDLGHFVSIGPATVSDDGLLIVSDPGVGIVKAGWHCGGNPGTTGTPHACRECWACIGNRCEPVGETTGSPLRHTADGVKVVFGAAGVSCSEDGNLCTEDVCRDGKCKHEPIECEACHGCTDGACEPRPFLNGSRCDEQGCQRCKDGSCVAVLAGGVVALANGTPGLLEIEAGAAPVAFSVAIQEGDCPPGPEVKWDFGDGFHGYGSATSHSYAEPGLYIAVAKVRCPPCPNELQSSVGVDAYEVHMKLEKVETVISEDGRFSEDTTIRVTAVKSTTGQQLFDFTGEVEIDDESVEEYYSQNGGFLPETVSISFSGTNVFEAKSLAGPLAPLSPGGPPSEPEDALIVTTNYPVFGGESLGVKQWVDEQEIHDLASGGMFDWVEARAKHVFDNATGDVAEVLSHVASYYLGSNPQGGPFEADHVHDSTTPVRLNPLFTEMRLDTGNDFVCNVHRTRIFTQGLIHEARHTYQFALTAGDFGAPDDGADQPNNDDDQDFLVDVVPVVPANILLDSTEQRPVCSPGQNNVFLARYLGDASADQFGVVIFALEHDAYKFNALHP